jgi:hypothetical protein
MLPGPQASAKRAPGIGDRARPNAAPLPKVDWDQLESALRRVIFRRKEVHNSWMSQVPKESTSSSG